MKKSHFLTLLALLGTAFAEQVTILGIKDMHANIDGMPQLATCVKQERLAAPGLLLLAAGDNPTGNPYVDMAPESGQPVIELMNGEHITNKNISGNLLRGKFYICPICGNVIHGIGDVVVSCCGVTLPAAEAEEADEEHGITLERVEDEWFITVHHPMTKAHFISFLAFVTTDRFQMVKLYPEGEAQTRLQLRRGGMLYYYCNRHGLFKKKI